MAIIAAFLWSKSPRTSISYMLVDDETMQPLAEPKIENFNTRSYWRFRSQAKQTIKKFFDSILEVHKQLRKPVNVEFKIVNLVYDIPYLAPAKESVFVYKTFKKFFRKIKSRNIKLKPQLRRKLSGKALRNFKRGLREVYLVSRRRDTHYEYHLWTVAMHATSATYETKLKRAQRIVRDAVWMSS